MNKDKLIMAYLTEIALKLDIKATDVKKTYDKMIEKGAKNE